jgi:ribosome-binding protein aMBF1 (putative translation factor)
MPAAGAMMKMCAGCRACGDKRAVQATGQQRQQSQRAVLQRLQAGTNRQAV